MSLDPAVAGARERTIAGYGSWSTPITSEMLVASAVGLSELAVDGSDVLWSESRPEEAGRVQLVRRRAGGDREELLPDGFSARTAVHEYGGAAWWARDGAVWFVNWADQRLYLIGADGSEPVALTSEPPQARAERYADGDLSPDGAALVCIRECHPSGGRGAREVINELVALDCRRPGTARTLVLGPDFVARPRFSPDGLQLCWIEWDHPNMPWDGTRLLVRDLATGVDTLIAGGPEESVLEPAWLPDGGLAFISDRSGWWNLYRWSPPERAGAGIEPLVLIDAEIGSPPWGLGAARYAILPDGSIVFASWREGYDGLTIRQRDGTLIEALTPFSLFADVRAAGARSVVVIAASTTAEPLIAAIQFPPDRGTPAIEVLRPPRDLTQFGVSQAHLAQPEAISFPTGPAGGDQLAHALFYPPTNPRFRAPPGERPPLLVLIHGGPSAETSADLNLSIQFWTSRGFAVVDVNYRGSTGYGRAYRELLRGQWGIVDVEDCVAAARHLAKRDRVDPQRMLIRGGSAGGFTVLAALAREGTPFAGGADRYGVADLEVLARDTHKFESRYLDSLIGEYPRERDVYVERSPITYVERFVRPLIVLQGLEDEVVAPNQSEMIVEALRGKGVPVAYVPFEGEQHGFRQAANIRRALDAELSFYAQILGFELPPEEGIEPVAVENLAGWAPGR
ncbi:MAG: S9 family peptidase [Solirubrobacteraceae bacterium]